MRLLLPKAILRFRQENKNLFEDRIRLIERLNAREKLLVDLLQRI